VSTIKVLIVDDHTMFRQGIRSLLESYDDIETVGEASQGAEAIEKVNELSPHVVLMDVAMPGMGGLEATRRIAKCNAPPGILVLTQYEDSEYVLSLLRAGARGYIAKTASGPDLVSAIRTIHAGKAYLYPSAAGSLIEEYLTHSGMKENEYERLTDREREVLQLVAEGHTNQEIAERLCISIKTVLRHRSDFMEKLGFHNRTELIKYAISRGLIEISPRF
jgi:DNA-binding NarL/FixJ family response regulator